MTNLKPLLSIGATAAILLMGPLGACSAPKESGRSNEPQVSAAPDLRTQGTEITSFPGGYPGTADKLFDSLATRAQGLNDRAGPDAVVIEQRTATQMVLWFDADKMFAKAPASVARAGRPMPVRLIVDFSPDVQLPERNVRATSYDLTGGEIAKYPEYKQWATSLPMTFVAGGR